MKKILALAAIAAISFSAFTGCKKSSSNTGTSSFSGTMKATVNGAPFSLPYCWFVLQTDKLTIIGANGAAATAGFNFPVLNLDLNTYTIGNTGTFIMDSTGKAAAILDSTVSSVTSTLTPTIGPGFTLTYLSTGSITISSSSSSTISGTFNIAFADGTTFTNGSFTAKVGP